MKGFDKKKAKLDQHAAKHQGKVKTIPGQLKGSRMLVAERQQAILINP
jgi:hypothetical protein